MIFHLLVYLIFRDASPGQVDASSILINATSLHSRPIPASLNATLVTNSAPACSCNQRDVLDIVWSCASTLFLCTWVAIYPNVPAPGEDSWRILWRRVKTMYWAMVAPEVILTWAARQFIGAMLINRLFATIHGRNRNNNPDNNWTMKHSHFLQMGGFHLRSEEYNGVLYPSHAIHLLSEGKISFSSITEADIEDKSKSDALSKIILVIQTLWFVVQCIGRHAQGLAVVQLEIATLAVISCTFLLSILWWHKPLNARQPIYLDLIDMQDRARREMGSSQNLEVPRENDDPAESAHQHTYSKEITRVTIPSGSSQVIRNETYRNEHFEPEVSAVLPHSDTQTTSTNSSTIYKSHDISMKDYLVQTVKSILKSIADAVAKPLRKRGLRRTIVNVTLFWPLMDPLRDIVHTTEEDFGSASGMKRVRSYFAFSRITMASIFNDANSPYPTTFQKLLKVMPSLVLSVVIILPCSALFGAIHCIAWNSYFPSPPEKYIWRVSAVVIAATGCIFPILNVSVLGTISWVPDLFHGTLYIFPVAYIVARHILFVESLISLRALLPSALETVSWSNFLPHF